MSKYNMSKYEIIDGNIYHVICAEANHAQILKL